MSQYCDSSILEQNWFCWLLSTATPVLDGYRHVGSLWTRVVEPVRDRSGAILKGAAGRIFHDPLHPIRLHCIVQDPPIYFKSVHGQITPTNSLCGVHPTAEHHQSDALFKRLQLDEYTKEIPTSITWHVMLNNVNLICRGVAMKFNLPEEEQADLATEALLQVIVKLENRKLVYTPGRAPVFNLLTTTIYRCMYSVLNRSSRQKHHLHKLAVDMQAGVLPNYRSLKVPTLQRR